MSAIIDEKGEGLLPETHLHDTGSDLDDVSSSLSDVEDQDGEQDDMLDLDSENESGSDANDSEAETERLDSSPRFQRQQQNVVLSSQADSQTFERSPSKLQKQFSAIEEDDDDEEEDEEEEEEEEEEDDDIADLTDDEGSLEESPKSLGDDRRELDHITATTSLEDSSGEGKGPDKIIDTASKKRKRSMITDPSPFGEIDLEEPARKRTGSVQVHSDDYAIDDAASANGDVETSNPISGNISDAESADPQDEDDEELPDDVHGDGVEDDMMEQAISIENMRTKSDTKRGRRKASPNGINSGPDDPLDVNDHDITERASHEAAEDEELDDTGEIEVEDADAAAKNEEEQEKKKAAMTQLGDIEHHFASFRDKLHAERLALLDREEWMLKQDPPTHPVYLTWLRCIDNRRDEKLRVEKRQTELKMETIQRSAVAKRSQILAQYYQELRDIREKKLESLGKQWYEIQHDRRGYGSNVEDYALKFPTRKTQQVKHQVAYNTEVSVLSGIAKYVGFPAAPVMAPATAMEIDADFEKMGRGQQKQPLRIQQGLPLQDVAALRAVTSASSFKPAEEQFIEKNPWANPQHPSHAHLIQRQSSAHHHIGQTSSNFLVGGTLQGRRHSHQHTSSGPVSGTFSSATAVTQSSTNGNFISVGRVSPMNPFANPSNSQKGPQSAFGQRLSSTSPEQNRAAPTINDLQQGEGNSLNRVSDVESSHISGRLYGFSHESGATVKREQPVVANGQY